MPGSYPDPSSYAHEAICILKEAYYEAPHSRAGTLILRAIDAIAQLKEEIKDYSQQRVSDHVLYDFSESNSAL